MSTKIYKNHTLSEYQQKYGEKGLRVVLKEDADKDQSLLENKSWWLIEDNYYEVESKKGFLAWWAGLAMAAKIGIIAGAAVLITGAITVPIIVSNSNNAATVNLNYHDPDDTWIVYTFDKSLTAIKTNETSWTIKVNVENNHPYNWYVAFGDIETATFIAQSAPHEGKAVPGEYNETVTLIDGINLSDYANKTLEVLFRCASV